jgi:hypothetical protein
MSALTEFQPNQILYLQHQATRLYAEVIQIVSERQLGWVRPLAMVELRDELDWQHAAFPLQVNDVEQGRSLLHDLRQGSDLLCPLSLFQMALDVEVVPILMALETFKQPEAVVNFDSETSLSSEPRQTMHLQLQEFVRCLWQTHPQVFQP